MRRLLLVHLTPHPRAVRLTIQHHLQAFERIPNTEWVLPYNAIQGVPTWLGRLDFDAVILHTTVLCMRWNPWFEQWKKRSEWLADLDALKIALPQDEYHHAETLDEWLDTLGVSVIGSVLDGRHRAELYPRMARRAAFYDLLTGYIDDATAERIRPRLLPYQSRPFDVVYRARNLPYWLGSHGQLKHRIGEAVAERATAHGLRVDISTRPQKTILGDDWLAFMARGRATIGAESGASSLDRRGEMQRLVNEQLAAHPALTFEDFAAQMPAGWDDHEFFALSPRHLEAVVTKTAQILVEGRYSGVLEPQRHYIPVRPDFSNLDDAIEAARDHSLLEGIAKQAYDDIYLSGRYSSRRLSETIGQMLKEHARTPERRRPVRFRPVVEKLAAAESEVERTLIAPVVNVRRVGPEGYAEMLAGLRLIGSDAAARRLLWDYLRSIETRNHVGPRQALGELLALGALRRARRGKFDGDQPFDLIVRVDEARQRLLIESRGQATDGLEREAVSAERLRELLQAQGWEFLWDHSRVGTTISYPLTRSRSVGIPLGRGPSMLAVLNWLARYRPHDVVEALSPVLEPR